MVTVWRGGSLAGEHGGVAEMHSVCAMQHMDYAGAAGLGLCLGLLEHSTDRWAVQLQLWGVGREVQCGVHLLAISATVPWRTSAAATDQLKILRPCASEYVYG